MDAAQVELVTWQLLSKGSPRTQRPESEAMDAQLNRSALWPFETESSARLLHPCPCTKGSQAWRAGSLEPASARQGNLRKDK